MGGTHVPTLVMGVAAFAIMWGMKRYGPKLPGVLVAVVVTTLASWALGFAEHGGKVVGEIPSGLPTIALPSLNLDLAMDLIASAVIISLVGFMEAISIAKAMAAKTKDRIDPNQELIGQGVSNIIGSLGQSYPVSGSFSRSAVNLNAGARTGMSSVFAGLVVLITLLFLTPLLFHLPQSVLAAVIMMAVVGLINFKAIRHAWEAHEHDGIAAIVTFVATMAFAPHLDNGILVGAGLAVGLFLYRTMKPRVALLGRFGDGTLRDLHVHPSLPTDERIIDRLGAIGITMVLSGMKRQVVQVLHRTHLMDHLGHENIFATEEMALDAIYGHLGETGYRPLRMPPPASGEPVPAQIVSPQPT
jgi:SulP family sulfate permease